MSNPTIVGLTGLARSGKTTVAQYLVEKHGFTLLNFADPLKEMVRKLDPIIGVAEEDGHGRSYDQVAYPLHLSDLTNESGEFDKGHPEDYVKSNFPEYRRVLQTLGTECIRGVDQNFWTRLLVDEVLDRATQGAGRFVVGDVRLPNEARAVRDFFHHKYNQHLIEVRRSGLQASGAHVTEQLAGSLGEDFVIYNDGTLVELGVQVDHLMEHIL